MRIYKSPQFPDNRAWFQSGFADGWSKPHPYGIDGAYFAQRTPQSTQRVGGLMRPPYDGLYGKLLFIAHAARIKEKSILQILCPDFSPAR